MHTCVYVYMYILRSTMFVVCMLGDIGGLHVVKGRVSGLLEYVLSSLKVCNVCVHEFNVVC